MRGGCEQALSFSPPRMPSEEVIRSPEYIPGAANWDKLAELNEEAASLQHLDMAM